MKPQVVFDADEYKNLKFTLAHAMWKHLSERYGYRLVSRENPDHECDSFEEFYGAIMLPLNHVLK
jgi:hypothetical protein